MGLSMTPEEIVKSYKQASNKKQQLKILSELNACPRKFIRTILIEGGVQEDEIPHIKSTSADRFYESKECAPKEAVVVEKKEQSPQEIPPEVIELAVRESNAIIEQIRELTKKLVPLQNFVKAYGKVGDKA